MAYHIPPWVKEHPYIVGGSAIGLFALLWLYFSYGGSSSSAGTSTTTSGANAMAEYYAAEAAAASGSNAAAVQEQAVTAATNATNQQATVDQAEISASTQQAQIAATAATAQYASGAAVELAAINSTNQANDLAAQLGAIADNDALQLGAYTAGLQATAVNYQTATASQLAENELSELSGNGTWSDYELQPQSGGALSYQGSTGSPSTISSPTFTLQSIVAPSNNTTS